MRNDGASIRNYFASRCNNFKTMNNAVKIILQNLERRYFNNFRRTFGSIAVFQCGFWVETFFMSISIY